MIDWSYRAETSRECCSSLWTQVISLVSSLTSSLLSARLTSWLTDWLTDWSSWQYMYVDCAQLMHMIAIRWVCGKILRINLLGGAFLNNNNRLKIISRMARSIDSQRDSSRKSSSSSWQSVFVEAKAHYSGCLLLNTSSQKLGGLIGTSRGLEWQVCKSSPKASPNTTKSSSSSEQGNYQGCLPPPLRRDQPL